MRSLRISSIVWPTPAGRLWPLGIALLLGLALLASTTARAQQLHGTVTQDPHAGLAIYDYHCDAPPSGQGIMSVLVPLLDPNVIQPPILTPPGWAGQVVIPPLPPAANFWSWDPLTDPKLFVDPNFYGPDPGLWVAPPAWLWFQAQSPADAVAPGTQLGGFQFKSPFLPTNAPAIFQDPLGQSFPVDPPTPDPAQPMPPPVPAIGPIAGALLSFALLLFGYRAVSSRRTPRIFSPRGHFTDRFARSLPTRDIGRFKSDQLMGTERGQP